MSIYTGGMGWEGVMIGGFTAWDCTGMGDSGGLLTKGEVSSVNNGHKTTTTPGDS